MILSSRNIRGNVSSEVLSFLSFFLFLLFQYWGLKPGLWACFAAISQDFRSLAFAFIVFLMTKHQLSLSNLSQEWNVGSQNYLHKLSKAGKLRTGEAKLDTIGMCICQAVVMTLMFGACTY